MTPEHIKLQNTELDFHIQIASSSRKTPKHSVASRPLTQIEQEKVSEANQTNNCKGSQISIEELGPIDKDLTENEINNEHDLNRSKVKF